MSRVCGVCKHEEIEAINAQLRLKTSLRTLEGLFHVTRPSLFRHKQHLPPEGVKRVIHCVVAPRVLPDPPKVEILPPEPPEPPEQPDVPPEIAAATVELSALRQSTADEISLLMRAKSGAARLHQIAVQAQKANALGIAVQALSKYREFLEFIARLTGELQPAGAVAIGVNVNIRQAWEACDPKVLRWALARHVREMLTYEPDVVQNLKLLSAGPCPECKRYGCPHDHL